MKDCAAWFRHMQATARRARNFLSQNRWCGGQKNILFLLSATSRLITLPHVKGFHPEGIPSLWVLLTFLHFYIAKTIQFCNVKSLKVKPEDLPVTHGAHSFIFKRALKSRIFHRPYRARTADPPHNAVIRRPLHNRFVAALRNRARGVPSSAELI